MARQEEGAGSGWHAQHMHRLWRHAARGGLVAARERRVGPQWPVDSTTAAAFRTRPAVHACSPPAPGTEHHHCTSPCPGVRRNPHREHKVVSPVGQCLLISNLPHRAQPPQHAACKQTGRTRIGGGRGRVLWGGLARRRAQPSRLRGEERRGQRLAERRVGCLQVGQLEERANECNRH